MTDIATCGIYVHYAVGDRHPAFVQSQPGAGASPGQKCGVDTHGECVKREPITGSGGRAPSGVQGQSRSKIEWKQTDGRYRLFYLPANAVSKDEQRNVNLNRISPLIFFSTDDRNACE